jgi:hypothetical protein
MLESEQLNELIVYSHNLHYISSPTGLVNPNDSPNGNQIYHLYSTGEISFQKGGWAYLKRSECFITGKIFNYQKLGFKFPKEAADGSTYAILTKEECSRFREQMFELISKSN